MGYYTNYYGNIKLTSKKAVNILKKMIKEEKEPFDIGDYGVGLRNSHLSIDISEKVGGEEMLKLCLFVANLDKKCSGEVTCEGEETADVWKITISDGKVSTKQGNIVYDKYGEAFDDIETKKKVYDITKDKKLLKEILLDDLE